MTLCLCGESGLGLCRQLLQRRRQIIRLKPKRSRLRLEDNPPALINQINPVRPSRVGLLGGVPELIQHCRELDSQLAHARSGDESALIFILGAGEDDLVFDIALHLPNVARMRLGDVHHQERNLALILIVELVEGGNLPPEGWSSVAAENHHHRLLPGQSRQLHSPGFIQLG